MSMESLRKALKLITASLISVIAFLIPFAVYGASVSAQATDATIKDGTYMLKNVGSGYAMNYAYGMNGNTGNPFWLSVYGDENENEQHFRFVHVGSGKYKIEIMQSEGGVLNCECDNPVTLGAKITGRKYTDNDTQKFYITSVGNNRYLIKSASNPQYVVAPPSGAKHAKLELQNYSSGNTLQLWEFSPDPALPTATPTPKPTNTPVPTASPTPKPTTKPTKNPTAVPTRKPTKAPTKAPAKTPTKAPTKAPTKTPTKAPTTAPTKAPAKIPTRKPAAISLTLNAYTANVICGKTMTLKATLTGSNSKITWQSSDTTVADVDANGRVTGKTAGPVTVTASAAGRTVKCTIQVLYKDVTNSKKFWYQPTNYLTNTGVVRGYDKQTRFIPENQCIRAQMVTFLWRLVGSPEPKTTKCKFKDVKKGDYFYKACIWGNENGIVEGYKDGTLGPRIVCARRHAVTFLWRLAGEPSPKSGTKNKFKDVKKSAYYYKAALWASEMKILSGYKDGTFRPNGDCLRRQMVTFLYKYDKYVNGKG